MTKITLNSLQGNWANDCGLTVKVEGSKVSFYRGNKFVSVDYLDEYRNSFTLRRTKYKLSKRESPTRPIWKLDGRKVVWVRKSRSEIMPLVSSMNELTNAFFSNSGFGNMNEITNQIFSNAIGHMNERTNAMNKRHNAIRNAFFSDPFANDPFFQSDTSDSESSDSELFEDFGGLSLFTNTKNQRNPTTSYSTTQTISYSSGGQTVTSTTSSSNGRTVKSTYSSNSRNSSSLSRPNSNRPASRKKKSERIRNNSLALLDKPEDEIKTPPPLIKKRSASCVICYDKSPNHIIVPCGHQCLCGDCCNRKPGINVGNKCPICRETIGQIIQVYNI